MGRGSVCARGAPRTNPSCWISARSGATGATSSIARATKIRELAAIINQLYIPVKVDRDERPDVDARYQAAISTISGQGGWPLTGFLLPDGRPFYGGTYFPPDDAMGRPGLSPHSGSRGRELPHAAARGRGSGVAACRSRGAMRKRSRARAENSMRRSPTIRPNPSLNMFDPRNGGFGRSPKFPHSAAIDLLLELPSGGRQRRGCWKWPRPRSKKWAPAASTIRSPAAFIAIRWMNDGVCHISRRCRTTIPSC